MTEYIKNLNIRGFRNLYDLDLLALGNVNLITGKNNAGKSTVLEAIRILASGGSFRTLREILSYREELSQSNWPFEANPIGNLFSGYPSLGADNAEFSIHATGDLPSQIREISAKVGWFTRREEDGRVFYDPAEYDFFGDADVIAALTLDLSGRKKVVPIDRLTRRAVSFDLDAINFPCVYLDPFSSRSTSEMGALWDSIALTDVEIEIVKALQIVAPDLLGISMVGGGERARSRIAIAKSAAFSQPVPLRALGDGVNRIFGIILSLCSAKGGILLVDEIENGLHYSAQPAVWRTIFRLAADLKVQVFATSHSWDCVQAFQEAAVESPSQGVLVRLTRKGPDLIPTSFSERELEIATRDQIEVR